MTKTHTMQDVNRWVLQILSGTFGVLGLDRFYVKQYTLGLWKLFTCGGLGLWALVDFIIQLVEGIQCKKNTVFSSKIEIDPSSIVAGRWVAISMILLILIVSGIQLYLGLRKIPKDKYRR